MRAQAIQDDFGIVSRGMAWRAAKTPPRSGAGALRIAPASPPPSVLMMPAGWYLDAYNRACLGQPPIPWREPLPTGKVYARALAEYLDIPEAVAVGAQRTRQLARPRQSAMYICRLATGMSLPQIGQIFGGRDHTTVMHAIAAVSGRLNDAETSEAEAAQIRAIKEIADRITRCGK